MIQWSQSTLYYFAWTLRSSWIRWRFVGLLWTFSFIQINGSCCAWRRRQDRKSRRSSHHLIWCFWWMQGRVWTCLCLSLRVSRVYNFCEGLGGTMSHPPVYRILIWWATYFHWEHAEQLHHHLVWRLHCIRLREPAVHCEEGRKHCVNASFLLYTVHIYVKRDLSDAIPRSVPGVHIIIHVIYSMSICILLQQMY